MRSSREDTARWISAFRKPNKSLQKELDNRKREHIIGEEGLSLKKSERKNVWMYCTLPDVLHAAVFWRINKEVSVRSANRFFTLFQNIIA